ncbi:M56 family metallopeptidase [uncultured Bacteroides sp.]|uniref:M56 family metallopeptidase n=1 Tax=uncultured Bacteroides sp. TaxID=162156 RepID=UPI003749EFF4
MGIFFVYILKSAVCMALFYLFYRLLLSKETFYRFNRISLLFILLLSLALPFAAAAVTAHNEVQQTVLTLEQLMMMADKINITSSSEETGISWSQIVLIIYLIGFLFFVCHHIYSLIRLFMLQRKARQVMLSDKIILLVHTKEISPFSWMNYIFISEDDLNSESSREILIHEEAHIRNYHSWDLLVTEICACFQWFNPAAWLIKQELQNIHEYEADETVINQGVDAKQYQLLLIKKAVGTRLYSMANSFNHSKLKKRITMMLKEKSNPWARLKSLYVLPVAAIAITAFASPEVSNELNDISAIKVSDLTSVVENKIVKNAQPEQSITQQDVKKESSDVAAFFSGKKKSAKKNLKSMQVGSKPLVIVNDKEISYEALKAIDPENIASINVLKGNSATTVYGDKGKNGVIQIQLKKSTSEKKKYTNKEKSFFLGIGPSVVEDGPATYYVDGKEMTAKEYNKLELSPDQIKSVNVNKKDSDNAVIEITTKSGKAKDFFKKK